MRRFFSPKFLTPLLLLAAPVAAFAQEAVQTISVEQFNELNAKIAEAQVAGDNAWMLVCCALVLMMTAPGLMMFYGGLVRSKNVLSICMQCVMMMGMVSILWAVYGYSIAFGEGNAFFGGTQYLFLKGVGMEVLDGLTIPHATFMMFQLMFAIITPALIVGAFAERFRFRALVAFMFLWVTFIYFPLAHMVWGPGGFLNAFAVGTGPNVPALDFAGGTVVHISSGISALVCAIYLGKRAGWPSQQFIPHSLVLTTIGTGLLWVGWFGFNAGSALASNGLASTTFAATHFSAAAAALSWCAVEWLTRGKPSLLGALSGAVAGLVAVTPASGFVTPMGGLLIGLIAGVVCWFFVTKVKEKLGYDDSLDVFGVHGIGGTLGAILTGIFATKAINPAFGEGPVGAIDGNWGQVLNQIIAVGVTYAIAIAGTFIILLVVDKTLGVRASVDQQEVGMDIADHGESGYHGIAA
ncbi:ammonium transporter [bacterium]|nr:ammonium transporter [bacterium]